MKEEIRVGVEFLRQFLAKYGQISQTQIDTFASKLTLLLESRYVNHWYDTQPMKGQAFRCLRLKHSENYMDPVLEHILKETSLKLNQLGLPNDFTLWIDPGEVSVRFGDQVGYTYTIAKLDIKSDEKNPSSPRPNQQTIPKSALIVENSAKIFDEKLTAFIRQNSCSTSSTINADDSALVQDDDFLVSNNLIDQLITLSAEKRTISPPVSNKSIISQPKYNKPSLVIQRTNSSSIDIQPPNQHNNNNENGKSKNNIKLPTTNNVNTNATIGSHLATNNNNNLLNLNNRLSYNDSCYYSSSSSSCSSSFGDSSIHDDNYLAHLSWFKPENQALYEDSNKFLFKPMSDSNSATNTTDIESQFLKRNNSFGFSQFGNFLSTASSPFDAFDSNLSQLTTNNNNLFLNNFAVIERSDTPSSLSLPVIMPVDCNNNSPLSNSTSSTVSDDSKASASTTPTTKEKTNITKASSPKLTSKSAAAAASPTPTSTSTGLKKKDLLSSTKQVSSGTSPSGSASGDGDAYCGYVESFPYYYKLNRLYNALAVQKMQTDRLKKTTTTNTGPSNSPVSSPASVAAAIASLSSSASSATSSIGQAQIRNLNTINKSPSPMLIEPPPSSLHIPNHQFIMGQNLQSLSPGSPSNNVQMINRNNRNNNSSNGGGYSMSQSNAAISYANHQNRNNNQRNNNFQQRQLLQQQQLQHYRNLSMLQQANNSANNSNLFDASYANLNSIAATGSGNFNSNSNGNMNKFSSNNNSNTNSVSGSANSYFPQFQQPNSNQFQNSPQLTQNQQQQLFNTFFNQINWNHRGQNDMLKS